MISVSRGVRPLSIWVDKLMWKGLFPRAEGNPTNDPVVSAPTFGCIRGHPVLWRWVFVRVTGAPFELLCPVGWAHMC